MRGDAVGAAECRVPGDAVGGRDSEGAMVLPQVAGDLGDRLAAATATGAAARPGPLLPTGIASLLASGSAM